MKGNLRHGVLTARDLEIVSWLVLVGAAALHQIAARFRLGKTQAYRRLHVLRDHGLVARHRLLAGRPTLYTPQGRRVRPATYEHALALTELIVRREVAGALIVGETALRRELHGQRPLDSRLTGEQLHVVASCPRLPDAVEALPSGRLLAYELELSSKGKRRRETALSSYATSSYERVAWICPEPRLRALVRAEIEALSVDEFQEVLDAIPR